MSEESSQFIESLRKSGISVEIKGPVELFDSNSELIHNIGDQIKDYVKDYKFVTGSGEWVETLGILHQIKKYLILIQKWKS